jgi:hypothetical protein
VPDRDRSDPALGLRGLAGIADDERINHGEGADHRLGKAGRGQRDGLARQPFERTVGAHVQQRVDFRDVPQPQAEGEQRMARRQGGVVIVGAAVDRASAVGHKRDNKIAEGAGAEAERAVAHVGIIRGVAPGSADARHHL